MNPILDQAADLRRLVRQTARRQSLASVHAAPSVLVAAGKTAAGATTVAVQLALASARDGVRVVLIDIDAAGGDVADRIGIRSQGGLEDVLEERLELHEALASGPLGMQVLPGCRRPLQRLQRHSVDRMTSEIRSLGRHADLIIYDAGNRMDTLQQAFWDAADEVLMVSTPDSISVLDSYQLFKDNRSPRQNRHGVIVNRASAAEQARDVFQRLNQSCSRFLKTDIAWRGWLPYSTALKMPPHSQDLAPLGTEASRVMEQLAETYRMDVADPGLSN